MALSKPLLLLALLAALTAAPLRAEPPPETKNIVYGQAGGHDLLLDLYLPASDRLRAKALPVVLYLHGGGWRNGSRVEGERLAGLCTQRGLAFASADYRLDGEALWPAQILDAKTACTRSDACGMPSERSSNAATPGVVPRSAARWPPAEAPHAPTRAGSSP